MLFGAWLLATLAALGALFLSEVMDLAPCVLCWWQRVAMFPLVIARHYGGQPLVAAQIILATTILGILAIPLWIAFGLHWTGV